jgi:hypothetical protein
MENGPSARKAGTMSTTPRKRKYGNIDANIINDARTQNRRRADNVRERQITVFVLIKRPCRLNIPHLAMNLARSQENTIQQLAIDMLPQLVGRKCASWIAQHCAHTTKLLRSRNYVSPRTAFYCDWLKFLDDAAARQFVQTWPRYDMQLQLRKVRAEHAERA